MPFLFFYWIFGIVGNFIIEPEITENVLGDYNVELVGVKRTC
jgi:hypothetical protein